MEKSKAILEKASSLGEAIRQLRELRGLTLRELAASVGVSAPFLSDLEHNRRRTDKLDAFARALSVDADLLKRLDRKLPAELRDWLSSSPEFLNFLKDFRLAGGTPAELMNDLRSGSDAPTPRRARKTRA